MSKSDVISLIALMVGLQGLLMVFYLKAIEKVKERHKKGLSQILRNKHLLKNNHDIFINTLIELSSIQRLYGALLVRLAKHSKLSGLEEISSEIGRYDYLLEKSMHEVNIFSSEIIRRQSSSRALAEEYGDLYSLELLQKCSDKIYEGKDKDLLSSIALLKSKISAKLLESK